MQLHIIASFSVLFGRGAQTFDRGVVLNQLQSASQASVYLRARTPIFQCETNLLKTFSMQTFQKLKDEKHIIFIQWEEFFFF